jgi:hypothetical protein
MIAEPTVMIRLDGDGPVYRPGDALSGHYWIESLEASQVKAVEVSVLWHTEGKGDEDMAVHEFWRRDADDGRPIDPEQPEPCGPMISPHQPACRNRSTSVSALSPGGKR